MNEFNRTQAVIEQSKKYRLSHVLAVFSRTIRPTSGTNNCPYRRTHTQHAHKET